MFTKNIKHFNLDILNVCLKKLRNYVCLHESLHELYQYKHKMCPCLHTACVKFCLTDTNLQIKREILHFTSFDSYCFLQLDIYCDVSLHYFLAIYRLSQNRCIVIISLSWTTYRVSYRIVRDLVIPIPNTYHILALVSGYVSYSGLSIGIRNVGLGSEYVSYRGLSIVIRIISWP